MMVLRLLNRLKRFLNDECPECGMDLLFRGRRAFCPTCDWQSHDRMETDRS
jgi:uncharacterized Zn finger protein (UPF0148 family)